MNKILVCMWYDENIKEYADLFRKRNEKYCNENNYDFIFSDKKYTDKPSSFNKISFIKKLLDKNEYDYYMWIDADAHFCGNEYLIENYINKYEDKDFIWSADITPNINTGVFIVKNSEYSKEFIQKWNRSSKTINKDWWEQGVFGVLWNDNILDIKNHSYVYHYGVLQHFKYTDSQLVYHMAGTDKNTRIKYSRFLEHKLIY